MGFEMIKDKLVITPQRMYAMVRLALQTTDLPRDKFLELLQPSAVTDNHDTAAIIYRYARRYGLLEEDQTPARRVRLAVHPITVSSIEHFRVYMQDTLLGVTDETQDNFLLSQFTAWYATQNEYVMLCSKTDYESKFHEALYPNATERVLADQPGISAWRTWAEFLGWGWSLKYDRRDETRLVPDATVRLRTLLQKVLPTSRQVAFSSFMQNLQSLCPELDGGLLFEQCWVASYSGELRGNRLSLMLSTALRVLQSTGEIELIYRKDASESWRLFPAQSYLNQVSHICRRAV